MALMANLSNKVQAHFPLCLSGLLRLFAALPLSTDPSALSAEHEGATKSERSERGSHPKQTVQTGDVQTSKPYTDIPRDNLSWGPKHFWLRVRSRLQALILLAGVVLGSFMATGRDAKPRTLDRSVTVIKQFQTWSWKINENQRTSTIYDDFPSNNDFM